MRPSENLDYNAISRGAISACLCQNPPSHKAFPCLLESSEVSRDILEIPCERGVRSTLGTPAHGISKMFLLTQSLSLSSWVLIELFYILKYPSIERGGSLGDLPSGNILPIRGECYLMTRTAPTEM